MENPKPWIKPSTRRSYNYRGPGSVKVLCHLTPPAHQKLKTYAKLLHMPLGWAINDLLETLQFERAELIARINQRYQEELQKIERLQKEEVRKIERMKGLEHETVGDPGSGEDQSGLEARAGASADETGDADPPAQDEGEAGMDEYGEDPPEE